MELLLLLLPALFSGSPPRRLVDAASFDLLALPEGTVDGELILLRGPGGLKRTHLVPWNVEILGWQGASDGLSKG